MNMYLMSLLVHKYHCPSFEMLKKCGSLVFQVAATSTGIVICIYQMVVLQRKVSQ